MTGSTTSTSVGTPPTSASATTASPGETQASRSTIRQVAIAGNPNAGKTSLFNALTGLRQKVANYAGVTVERKEGQFVVPAGAAAGDRVIERVNLVDLPGCYSLAPKSLDERIARDVLLGRRADTPAPEAVVVVVDAAALERNCYLVTQVVELGLPVVVALNLVDVAAQAQVRVDVEGLSRSLGLPVVATNGRTRAGIEALRTAIGNAVEPADPLVRFAPPIEAEVDKLASAIAARGDVPPGAARAEAIRLLLTEGVAVSDALAAAFLKPVAEARERLTDAGVSWWLAEQEARYAAIARLVRPQITKPGGLVRTPSDRIDAVLTHRVFGLLVFVVVMALIFQAIFTWAAPAMDAINAATAWLQGLIPGDGALASLARDGVIAGVGAVLIFLPQILLLFLFLAILEDTGYLARAAFVMDRPMRAVGLHGKAFIPLLSSFACAIPGVMAARTIENNRERLATIMIAPLMSCSARLPVYILLIGTFFAGQVIWGGISVAGLLMFGVYVLGIVGAVLVAWVFKKTLIKGKTPPMLLELPSYKWPNWPAVIRVMWQRALVFLKKAGTIILAISIVLWALLSYPGLSPDATAGYAAQRLQAARAARAALAPAVAPLGVGLATLPANAAASADVAATVAAWDAASSGHPALGPLLAALDADDADFAAVVDSAQLTPDSPAYRAAAAEHARALARTLAVAAPDVASAARAWRAERSALTQALGTIADRESGARIRNSFGGRFGRMIEPAIAPLGYDWKIGIGLIGSFAAREVFVSTLGVVYNLSSDSTAEDTALRGRLRSDRYPPGATKAGAPVWTSLVALSLLVYYVFAFQCMSTLAIVVRETGSWKWALFQVGYMMVLAYGGALAVYQGGLALGYV